MEIFLPGSTLFGWKHRIEFNIYLHVGKPCFKHNKSTNKIKLTNSK